MIMAVLIFLCLLFSVSVHETSHGFVAYLLGDKTAKEQGRLTLNPLKHIDPFGTIVLPLILLLSSFITGGVVPVFGYAKPVPVNHFNFKNPRLGMAIVGIAGPLSNIILAFLSAVLLIKFKLYFTGMKGILIIFLQLNLLLTVFNLMPIPPLDGSRLLSWILPKDVAIKYDRLSRFGFVILILILQTDIISTFYIKFSELFIMLCEELFQ